MKPRTTTGADTDDTRPGMLTTERWVAVYMLGALGFLIVARRAFSDFVPR